MVYGYKCVHCSLFCLRSIFVNTFIIVLLFLPQHDVMAVLHYRTRSVCHPYYIYIYICICIAYLHIVCRPLHGGWTARVRDFTHKKKLYNIIWNLIIFFDRTVICSGDEKEIKTEISCRKTKKKKHVSIKINFLASMHSTDGLKIKPYGISLFLFCVQLFLSQLSLKCSTIWRPFSLDIYYTGRPRVCQGTGRLIK